MKDDINKMIELFEISNEMVPDLRFDLEHNFKSEFIRDLRNTSIELDSLSDAIVIGDGLHRISYKNVDKFLSVFKYKNKSDWRLPDVKELKSILREIKSKNIEFIETEFCSSTISKRYENSIYTVGYFKIGMRYGAWGVKMAEKIEIAERISGDFCYFSLILVRDKNSK